MDNGHWQNRIVGHGTEDPMQLLANPLNARIHPKHQQDTLTGSLNEVGIVQSVIVNRRTSEQWGDGDRNIETMLDGHLRAELAISKGQDEIPVTYVDLTPNEEAIVLATFDSIGALAVVDDKKLDELLREIETGDESLNALLAEMVGLGNDADAEWQGMPEFENEDLSSAYRLIVHFESAKDKQEFANIIGQKVSNKKLTSIWHPEKKPADLKSMRYES